MTLMNQVDLALSSTDRELADNGRHLAAPSIESMLKIAIERNVSPEAMEKLVALYERVEDRRAEQAFNAAMDGFRSKCPVILKNRTADFPTKSGGRASYQFADLPFICSTIDPILHEFGLSYTWDFENAEGMMTTICTVHHVDGHKRSAKFSCTAIEGAPLMSSAQKAGSASTFGRRYSLQGALGICTDVDDDGRSAAPNPKPNHDQAAPRVAPRDQRSNQASTADHGDGLPRVTADGLNAVMNQWLAKNRGKTMQDFAAWAKARLGTESNMTRLPDWNVDALEFIRQQIAEAK